MRTGNNLNEYRAQRDAMVARLRTLKEQRDFLDHPLINSHYDSLLREINQEIVSVRGALFDLMKEWGI